MSEYTPSLDDVRRTYADGEIRYPGGITHDEDEARGNAEFDRWLDDYTASIRNAALDEAAEVAEQARRHRPGTYATKHFMGRLIASAIRALKEEKK